MSNPWFPYRAPAAEARLRLFCFPFAGGTAALFRRWPSLLPPWVEVVGVQLPGREARRREPLYTSISALVSDLCAVLAPELDRPFALFGHSLGAMVSFELARELRRRGLPLPGWMCLSARRAPQIPSDETRLSDLDAAAFSQHMRDRYQGIPQEVLREPDLMNMFVPIIRADITMVETYSYQDAPPLDCPLTVVGGIDDPSVSMALLHGWSQHTTGAFSLRHVPGDHFFVRSQPETLLSILGEGLNLLAAQPPAEQGAIRQP